MGDLILIIAVLIVFLYGFRIMKKIDYFLNEIDSILQETPYTDDTSSNMLTEDEDHT